MGLSPAGEERIAAELESGGTAKVAWVDRGVVWRLAELAESYCCMFGDYVVPGEECFPQVQVWGE